MLLKHDLLGRVTEALRFQPTEVRLRPAPPTRIHPTVSQQEGIEPLSYPTLGVLEVFSATHQITDRFLLFIRNPDRHQVPRAMLASQRQRVTPIGLDALHRDAAATAMAPPQSSRSPFSSPAGGTAGAQAASAVYYVRLEAFAERRVRSMVLLR